MCDEMFFVPEEPHEFSQAKTAGDAVLFFKSSSGT
jgi:hypothetical protein